MEHVLIESARNSCVLGQLLKARLDKNKKMNSRITDFFTEVNALLVILKEKSQLLSNLQKKILKLVIVNKAGPFDIENIVRKAFRNTNQVLFSKATMFDTSRTFRTFSTE